MARTGRAVKVAESSRVGRREGAEGLGEVAGRQGGCRAGPESGEQRLDRALALGQGGQDRVEDLLEPGEALLLRLSGGEVRGVLRGLRPVQRAGAGGDQDRGAAVGLGAQDIDVDGGLDPAQGVDEGGEAGRGERELAGDADPEQVGERGGLRAGLGEAQGVAEGRGAEAGDVDAEVRGDEHAGGAIAVGAAASRALAAPAPVESARETSTTRSGEAAPPESAGAPPRPKTSQPSRPSIEHAGQGHPAVPQLLGAACLAERAVGVAGGPSGRRGGHGAGGEHGGGLQPALGEQDGAGLHRLG